MGIPISVLDLSPIPSGAPASQALHDTVELARIAEAAGYRRFWLAEHHNIASVTSSSPEVMISAVASATNTIRVGSGGIMLPNHSPLKVAETFRALAGLFGDRIDLGLGRAPGTDPRTAIALRRSHQALTADDFPDQFTELRGYVDGFEADHPFRGIVALPDDVPLPPVWILGSSYYGAQAAALFGTGFAYAGHFGGADAGEATRIYRQNFRPSEGSGAQAPHVILGAAAIAHPDAERARRYLPEGPGAVFSFGVVGGRDAGRRFIEAVELCSHLANIGDARTLVIHPGSTTHGQLSVEQLETGGVSADLIRISVGLEDVEDILWDLDQALTVATKGA